MFCGELENNREGVEKIRDSVSIRQGLVHQMLNARGSILLDISHARIMSSLEPPSWDYENLLLSLARLIVSCLRHDAYFHMQILAFLVIKHEAVPYVLKSSSSVL